ncbi:MAG: hypothetical protein QG599_1456 [Pseudomonadota bacterium]|nr:hypothetical protein [Pseudomonadota bacterium]
MTIKPYILLAMLCLAILMGSIITTPAQAGDTRAIERELQKNDRPAHK